MEVIRHLTTDIGTRLAGSSNERTAAEYIASKFDEIGLDAKTDKFWLMGWELLEEPILQILSPERSRIVCAPNIFSSSTPEGGAEGTLKFVGKTRRGELGESDRYAIINDDGEELAYVIALKYPMARNGRRDLHFPAPEVNVDASTGKMLKSYFDKRTSVRMKLDLKTRFNPQAKSYNVIASIRGSKDPERVIVITSHIDTQVDSVGANDDASGIGVIYSMAKKLVEEKPSKTVRFCVFGSEEVGLRGSRYYAKRLKETGELRKVEFVLCFDEVGQEEQYHRFRATNDWLLLKLCDVLDSFKASEILGEDIIEEFPKRWKLLAFHSDHAAFVEEGIPAISIGGGGNGDYVYSATGSSGDLDTLDKVSPEMIEYKTKIALEILKKIGV
jgi:hypothetical protein